MAATFDGITVKWKTILYDDEIMRDLFATTMATVARDTFTPAPSDIFRFARYSFENLRVVILGMDPYPAAGAADGLAFSASRLSHCPVSLGRIFNVLKTNKLIDQSPATLDLGFLAAQGVLLLNTALTTRVGDPGSHIKLWKPYTDSLIAAISANTTGLIWCLWGAHAQDRRHMIATDRSHEILTHCHPVAMMRPSFSECPHFLRITARYPNMIWDARNAVETHLYTDGAAPGNQFQTCRAAWGVACTSGLLKGRTWAGLTESREVMYKNKMETARPTNIRAEGEALIRALEIARTLKPFKVVINSDSMFWIKDMCCTHIPNWVETQQPFTSKRNSDLVIKFWDLYNSVKNAEFRFVPAWHNRDRPIGDGDLTDWLGNQLAEQTAQHVLP